MRISLGKTDRLAMYQVTEVRKLLDSMRRELADPLLWSSCHPVIRSGLRGINADQPV